MVKWWNTDATTSRQAAEGEARRRAAEEPAPLQRDRLAGARREARAQLGYDAAGARDLAERAATIQRRVLSLRPGDPTYRAIPADTPQAALAVSHLHLNTADIEQDVNIVLPLRRFQELAAAGKIGGLADAHYSFMGYQGFPPEATAWAEQYGPEIAARFKQEKVDCVLLTPA